MSRPKLLALLCLAVVCAPARAVEPPPLAIAIHGGAGVIDPAKMTPQHAASYRAGLAAALDAGYAILEHGGSSLDAVTAAVRTDTGRAPGRWRACATSGTPSSSRAW